MILGIGNDLVDIRRIERSLDRYGSVFINRVFTPEEIEKSEMRAQRAASYAKFFAAKEACSKALGTGFSHDVYWRDMAVDHLPTGKPSMILTGGALERLNAMVPEGFVPQVDLTITDEYPMAQAFVVISAWPSDWPKPA